MGCIDVSGLAGEGTGIVQRKRILFTTPNLDGGGAQRVLLTLLSRIDRDRFDSELVIVDYSGKYLQDIPKDIKVTGMGGMGPLALFRLVRLIWKLRPDAIFSTLSFFNTLILLLRPFLPSGIQVVVRENTIPSQHINSKPFGWLRWKLYPIAHRMADTIVCQCEEMKNDLKRLGIGIDHLTCIPNPLDIKSITKRSDEIKNPYPQEGTHLVYAGRLIPLKGLDTMLEVLARVSNHIPNVILHLVGEGPEEENLKMQAKDLGIEERVIFEGFSPDPFPYYYHARLFILTSLYEGFPNATLEAMACGTPVVSFDYPGGTPVVEGVNGWIIPAGDITAMADRIITALDSEPLSREQVIDSIQHHDVDKVIKIYEAIFDNEN